MLLLSLMRDAKKHLSMLMSVSKLPICGSCSVVVLLVLVYSAGDVCAPCSACLVVGGAKSCVMAGVHAVRCALRYLSVYLVRGVVHIGVVACNGVAEWMLYSAVAIFTHGIVPNVHLSIYSFIELL